MVCRTQKKGKGEAYIKECRRELVEQRVWRRASRPVGLELEACRFTGAMLGWLLGPGREVPHTACCWEVFP